MGGLTFKMTYPILTGFLLLTAVALGIAADRLFLPLPAVHEYWMPIKLIDADIPKIQALTKMGQTYTRFAKLDGVWGITAVRQSGGIWVVPCQEVQKSSGVMK